MVLGEEFGSACDEASDVVVLMDFVLTSTNSSSYETQRKIQVK